MTNAVAVAELTEPTARSRSLFGTLRRWASVLFVDAPPTDRLTIWSVLVAGIGVAAGAAASLLRQSGIPAWDSIWAEDGAATLSGAVNQSFVSALTTPVSGYYQTLPRLLAEPVAYLPSAWAAKAFALEAAGVTATFALIVYVASGAHLRTPLARLAASAIAVIPPVGMVDVPNSLCNLHWPGLYALFWVLLWVPRGRVGKAVAITTAVIVGLTNIMALVFVPLALVRGLLGPKGWYSRALAGAVGLGLLPQVIGLATGVAAARNIQSHPGFFEPLRYFFRQVVPASVFGEEVLPGSPDATSTRWLIALGVWVGLGLVVLLAPFVARPNRPLAALLGVHAFVFWMAAAGSTGLLASRYMTTVAMCVIAALVALLLPDVDGARTGPLIALALALAVVWTANYSPAQTPRSNGPRWSTAINKAKAACADPTVQTVAVRIAPVDPSIDWRVSLPCTYVGRG